jgi:PAS domain S-box-containing protein
VIRFSPSRLALSYIALGALALALLAIPLWYGYRANLGTFRAYVPGAEMQRLVEIFHRDGPQAVAAAVEAYLPSLPRDEVIVFVDPEKRPLAGSLRAWPAEVPDLPGTYGLVIGLGGDASMRVVTTHLTLPGGYQLLMGRESVRFDSLVARFWYGIAGAVAIVLTLGLAFAWLLRRERGQLEGQIAQRTAALRRSEERYARVMQASEDGFWEWVVASDEFYASPRMLALYGLPPDTVFRSRKEFLSRFPFHPEDLESWQRAVAAHLAGETARVDIEVRAKLQGQTGWIHLTAICLRDASGAEERWTGSVSDVTERRRAQDALRRSEERYARAMEGSDAGHWDWNIVTDEMFVSERAREMLALPAGPLPARRAEIMALVPQHPADRDAMHANVVKGIESGSHERDYRIIPRPGEMRWLRSRGKVYKDARGTAVRMTGSLIDITERRLAADALRASEERYSLAMEASEEGHFDWNVRTDEIFVSAHIKKVFGFPLDAEFRTRDDLIARVAYYPNDRRWLDEMARTTLAGTALAHEFEYRILREGQVRWLRARWKIFRDAAGAAQRVIGVVTDVTDRQRAADELRASEQRFRALTELSSDWYWQQDENLRFTYLSGQVQGLTGYSGESSLGKLRWEIANMTPLSCSWAEHQAVLAARQPFRDLECRRVGPDGTVRYLSISGAPIFDEQGNFRGYRGIGRNITERKRVEEALRQSEERYALAVAGSNEGIFDWDLVSDRVYVSYRAQELFGLPRGELWRPRRDWRHIVTFHPDDAPRLHDSIKAHIEGGAPTYDVEFRIVMPGGGVRWFRQRGIALRDPSGKAYRMVGSIGDVTLRRQAEEELKAMERKLRQAQRLEAMGTLAGGIAHDFNNILGAILGYGEMALRDAPRGSRLRRDLDSIITAGERGRALVDRVLAFSRSGVGERVAVNVEKVVREAIDLLSAKLPENVTLHAKLHAGPAAMLGDATQVHQVLMNLATNAVQAMPAGGTLRVSLETMRVDAPRATTIGSLEPGEYLVLKVADTGTGIASEILERIFDPFFTTKEVGTGTGLGLSLVHGIVSELGGAVDVASAVGKGSTFSVYLPRSGDAADSDVDEELAMPRGDGQRVLVVDDEEPLVKLATRTLEELGYAPVGFTSSAAALAAFRADPQRFDAVITDERMPGMSGSALIREVRGIRNGIPIVLMSGYIGGAVASQAREAGAEEVLKKPLSARDLAASLARVLQP